MLGLDPSISDRRRLLWSLVPRFSGLRSASPENDGLAVVLLCSRTPWENALAPLKKCHIRSRNAARLSHFARIYIYSNALDIIPLS